MALGTRGLIRATFRYLELGILYRFRIKLFVIHTARSIAVGRFSNAEPCALTRRGDFATCVETFRRNLGTHLSSTWPASTRALR
jgi:hypothetical protein